MHENEYFITMTIVFILFFYPLFYISGSVPNFFKLVPKKFLFS